MLEFAFGVLECFLFSVITPIEPATNKIRTAANCVNSGIATGVEGFGFGFALFRGPPGFAVGLESGFVGLDV